MVYRGNNNANANAGVSYTNANNDASNTNANVGSRLDNQSSAYITGDALPNEVPRGTGLGKSMVTVELSCQRGQSVKFT